MADKEWDIATIEQTARDVAESQGVSLKNLAQPLRAAVTGRTSSPGLFEVLDILGREIVIKRVNDLIAS